MRTGRTDPTSEVGSLTAFVAVFALALFSLTGLAVDGGRAVAARSQAAGAAEQAARAGAGQISVAAIRSGQVVVDPTAAHDAAERSLDAAGLSGVVIVNANTVTVRVDTSEATVMLGVIGIDHIGISVSATATNVHGVTRGD